MLKRTTLLAIALAAWLLLPAAARAQHDSHAPAVEKDAHKAVADSATGAPVHATEHKPDLIANPADPQTWYAALWVVIIFLVLVAILYPTAWKNVLAGLKKREERIRKDIADAEAARAKAEATLKEYNTRLATAEQSVRDMVSKAAADGERIAASIRTRAQQEAEEIKERATKDIEAASKQAVADIYEKAADLATTIASKIIHKNLNADDQRELVNRSLEQLQTVGGGKR